MKILHILSQYRPTGAEFYAVALANDHIQRGHVVHIISDTLTAPTQAHYHAQTIAKRSFKQRIINSCFIRNFVKKHHIDIVHAHSRAASWVAYFALLGTKVPLISTIHGRQAIHPSSKLFDIYGDHVIAVCNNLKTHLTQELHMNASKITIAPNAIDFSTLKKPKVHKETTRKVITFIGRTNDAKGEVLQALCRQSLPTLLKQYPAFELHIIGGNIDELPHQGAQLIQQLNEAYGHRIKPHGFVYPLSRHIAAADLIICAGRVAVEALYLEKPVLALGENCCHSILTPNNLQEAMDSNSGDMLPRKQPAAINYLQLTKTMSDFLAGKTPHTSLKKTVAAIYDVHRISKQVLRIYRSTKMRKYHPQHIPILMYHKIPKQPFETQHQTYVTQQNFEKHLRFFKRRGFTPITFQDYFAFANGFPAHKLFPRKPLILTFDDGYLDNYTNMLPLMQQYGYKGVLFLLGDAKADYNFWDADQGEHYDSLMSLSQKQAFVKEGWEIGAHTLSHPNLTALTEEQAKHEIAESKKRLEQDLKTTIISFAYPSGYCNEKIKQLVKDTGFQFGIATDTGGLHLEDDPYQIFRVNIFPQDTTFQLFKKTAPWYRKYYFKKRGY
ncbi:MAG: polysaccharide deacetylase family protein [Cytophagales bacterium]|nr:polysaccharide deacetylase family protein [Cytophagales bacterium]